MKPVFIYSGKLLGPINLSLIVCVAKKDSNLISFYDSGDKPVGWCFDSETERDEVYNRILEKFGEPI